MKEIYLFYFIFRRGKNYNDKDKQKKKKKGEQLNQVTIFARLFVTNQTNQTIIKAGAMTVR